MEIRKLETFHPEAKRAFLEKQSDGFSFADFLDESILALASVRKNSFLTLNDMGTYIGDDDSSPAGKKTFCAHCLVKLIISEAETQYPDNQKLKTVIGLYEEIDRILNNGEIPPREILQAQKGLESALSSWPIEDLQYIQNIFIKIKNEILAKEKFGGTEMIARYRAKVRARAEDEDPGAIVKKDGKLQYIGSYVAVGVNKHVCFRKIVFVLGLEPGYHLLAACGSAGYDKYKHHQSHLYHLKNFRLKLPDRNSKSRHWWDPLPSKTYSEAFEKKQYFEKTQNTNEGKSIIELWKEARLSREETYKEIWVEGEALKTKLETIPSKERSHTVRGLALRKNQFTGNWEILLLTEKGDNKKFPATGLPGGGVDDGESFGQALERETVNESGCGKIKKIIAQVAEIPKAQMPGYAKENTDHYFLIEPVNEYYLPGTEKERAEIKAGSPRWVPLSELASFTYQDKTRPVANIQIVEEKKMMYFGHALNIFRILSHLSKHIPGLKLPSNWEEFGKNIQGFKERF